MPKSQQADFDVDYARPNDDGASMHTDRAAMVMPDGPAKEAQGHLVRAEDNKRGYAPALGCLVRGLGKGTLVRFKWATSWRYRFEKHYGVVKGLVRCGSIYVTVPVNKEKDRSPSRNVDRVRLNDGPLLLCSLASDCAWS